MALFVQIWLLACTVSVNSQTAIPLNFLDRELDGSSLKFENPLGMLEMFSRNYNRPGHFGPQGRFGLGTGHHGLYGDRPFGAYGQPQQPFQDKGFSDHIAERPPAPVTEIDELDTKPEDAVIKTHNFGANQPQEQHREAFVDSRIDSGPLKVTLLPATVTEKENLALKINENKTIYDGINTKPTEKANENKTINDEVRTKPTEKNILHTSNDAALVPEKVSNVTFVTTESENVFNETFKDKNQIVFPDKVDQVKEQMNAHLQNNNNNTIHMNVTNNNEDINMTKNMEAVLVPVEIMQNQIANMNTVPNFNGNKLLIPQNSGGQMGTQVMTITNDIFPTRSKSQQSFTQSNSVAQALYTNILNVLTPNGMQQALLMPLNNGNTYQNSILTNISPTSGYNNVQSVIGENQNMGVPSDIPQDPLIATLLTPEAIKNIGRTDVKQPNFNPQKLTPSSYAKTLGNIPFNPIPSAIFDSESTSSSTPRSTDNIAPQRIETQSVVPARIENTQTLPIQTLGQQINLNGQTNNQNPQQYYIVNGNLPNTQLNNGNGEQSLILNQQANLNNAINGNNQKYMLVTVNNQQYLPQNGQGNTAYTLINGNPNQGVSANGVNTISLNGQTYAVVNGNVLNGQYNTANTNTATVNGNGQSNLYTLLTIPNGVQNGGNNFYVRNAPVNPGYQTQPSTGYSIVSFKDEDNPKPDSHIHHNQ